jgi:hypothetical protein
MKNHPCKIYLVFPCCDYICQKCRDYIHDIERNITPLEKLVYSKNKHIRKSCPTNIIIHYNSYVRKWNEIIEVAEQILIRQRKT